MFKETNAEAVGIIETDNSSVRELIPVEVARTAAQNDEKYLVKQKVSPDQVPRVYPQSPSSPDSLPDNNPNNFAREMKPLKIPETPNENRKLSPDARAIPLAEIEAAAAAYPDPVNLDDFRGSADTNISPEKSVQGAEKPLSVGYGTGKSEEFTSVQMAETRRLASESNSQIGEAVTIKPYEPKKSFFRRIFGR